MSKLLCILALCLLARGASGCECKHYGLDVAAARNARNVFVFLLRSSEMDPVHKDRAIGTIEIVESLRGSGTSIRRIAYSTDSCCGLRMDVGHHYFAFTNESGPDLVVNAANLFVPFQYDHGDPLRCRKVIARMIRGEADIPEKQLSFSRRSLNQ